MFVFSSCFVGLFQTGEFCIANTQKSHSSHMHNGNRKAIFWNKSIHWHNLVSWQECISWSWVLERMMTALPIWAVQKKTFTLNGEDNDKVTCISRLIKYYIDLVTFVIKIAIQQNWLHSSTKKSQNYGWSCYIWDTYRDACFEIFDMYSTATDKALLFNHILLKCRHQFHYMTFGIYRTIYFLKGKITIYIYILYSSFPH